MADKDTRPDVSRRGALALLGGAGALGLGGFGVLAGTDHPDSPTQGDVIVRYSESHDGRLVSQGRLESPVVDAATTTTRSVGGATGSGSTTSNPATPTTTSSTASTTATASTTTTAESSSAATTSTITTTDSDRTASTDTDRTASTDTDESTTTTEDRSTTTTADAPGTGGTGSTSTTTTQAEAGGHRLRISLGGALSETGILPGDSGRVVFTVETPEEPVTVRLTGTMVENAENGVVEPEAVDPDEDDPPGGGSPMSGELADGIRAVVWYDPNDDSFDGGGNQVVETILDASGIDPAGAVVAEGTLREVLDRLSAGVSLAQYAENADGDCFPGSTTGYVGLDWALPVEHANELQTDSTTFDLGFVAGSCTGDAG